MNLPKIILLVVLGKLSLLWSTLRYTTGYWIRGVAQPGSASALGAEGRMFESSRPDQIIEFF